MLHPIRISSRGRIFNVLDGKPRMIKFGGDLVSIDSLNQKIVGYSMNPLVDLAMQFHAELPFVTLKSK